MNRAIGVTERHIHNNGYTRNPDVTNVWQEAFDAFAIANIQEGHDGFLYKKVEFCEGYLFFTPHVENVRRQTGSAVSWL